MTKRNKLGLAIAAALSIGSMAIAPTVEAANIASNGIGEMIYFPYYSTTGGKVSFMRLTNNSFDTIAVKIKVREGTISTDARDFHLFLSPRDVWTANIHEVDGVVRITTADTSCTVPSKDRGWKDDNSDGNNDGPYWIDIPATGVSGSQEGYVVAQVMGTADGRPASQGSLTYNPVSMVKHVGNDPIDCHSVSAAFDYLPSGTNGNLVLRDQAGFIALRSQFTDPSNALSGAGVIFNPANNTLTETPVTVVANVVNRTGSFQEVGATAQALIEDVTSNDVIVPVGFDDPSERNAAPLVAGIYDDVNFATTAIDFSGVANATAMPVSGALMQSSLGNYIDTTGGSSWIVTFPTKRLHQVEVTPGVFECSAPFPLNCRPEITQINHSVRNLGATSYVTNEEESEFFTPPPAEENLICFSGTDASDVCRPDEAAPIGIVSLPTEVNVVTMGTGNALASRLTTNVSNNYLNSIAFGWMEMRFSNARAITGNSGATSLFGLPAIGFSYSEYPLGNGVTSTVSLPHVNKSPLRR